MARVRRRRSFGQGSGRKRPTWWAREHIEGTLTAGVAGRNDALSDYKLRRGITSVDPGTTVSGGHVNWVADAADTGITSPSKISVGIIVLSEITAAHAPAPFDEPHADWMYLETRYLVPGMDANAVRVTSAETPWRSRRRLDEIDMNLWIVLQCQVAASFQVDLSVLLKLR